MAAVALPQLVPPPQAAAPRPAAPPATSGSRALDAMLLAERDKVRRLMHSLRDARCALKAEREARRRFESLYLDLKASVDRGASAAPAAPAAAAPGVAAPRPVSGLQLDGRLALRPSSTAGSVDKLVHLLDSAETVHSEPMLNDLLTKVMQRSRDLVGASRCTLYMADHSAKEIWSLVTDLQTERLPGEQSPHASVRVVENSVLRLPMASGLAGWCASTGQLLRVADVYKDSRFHREIDQQSSNFTSTSCICVPLFADDGKSPCAVIQMLNKVGAEQFNEGDEEALRTVATHCHQAVQKCSLFVQLGKLLNSTKQLMTVVDMEKMIAAIMQRTGELLACEHCCLFVVEVSRLDAPSPMRLSSKRGRDSLGDDWYAVVAAPGRRVSLVASSQVRRTRIAAER